MGYFFIVLFSENCKNTWVKHVNFKSKNSKMYKIKLTHIIISKPYLPYGHYNMIGREKLWNRNTL